MNKLAEKKSTWDVLLIGGASGTGKTSVSYPLARHFDIGITEVDDLYIVLEHLTTPEQQPLLHYWQTNPEAARLSAEEILELHIAVCRVLAPAIKAVVVNHIETQIPIVLEGDYLLPEIAVWQEDADLSNAERVRGIFIYEPEEKQILENFARREPDEGDQVGRARVSWLFGQWLKDECQRLGLIAMPSRPWHTLEDRIREAIV